MPIMIVVFLGLSAIVVIALGRTLDLQPRLEATFSSEEESKARTRSTERVLGPSEFLPQIQAKSDVADAVIRGDINLIEAAKAFRDLSKSDPGFVQRMIAYYPEADEIEIYARSVISHVNVHLQGKSQQKPTVERLQAELSNYIQSRANLPSKRSRHALE